MNEFIDKNWIKNATLFISSQTISLLGSSIVQFAILWHITLGTQSGVMMTIYIICGFIPSFIISPFAGVWADRYSRKGLIIFADGMIKLATFVLAIVMLNGFDFIWLLFLMAAIRAFGSSVQMPAISAILPQIVPQSKLTRVNGINATLQALIMFVSPMISALLFSIMALEMIFFIDVVTAIIAISVLIFFLKIKRHKKALVESAPGYFTDFKLGITYIRQHAFLKTFFLFMAFFLILMAPASFLPPLQVARSFGEEVWRLSAIEVAFSVGMMLGGGLIAVWGGVHNKIKTQSFAALVIGVATIALGVVPVFFIYLCFMFLIGTALPMFNTPSSVLLQEKVVEDFLGRVFGVLGMILTAMMPLGMLVFGPIADFISIEVLLVGTGVALTLLATVYGRNKKLLEAGVSTVESAEEESYRE